MSEAVRHTGSDPVTNVREFCRFFSVKLRVLISLRLDGSAFTRAIGEPWKQMADPAEGEELQTRLARWQNWFQSTQDWQKEVKELPSVDELEREMFDAVSITPTGHEVEPDGRGPDGVSAWPVLLGLI